MEGMPRSKLERIKQEGENVKKEVREQTVGLIIAAFGLVAGLAWNDAVKSLIEYFFPLNAETLVAKFTYALILTVILAVLAYGLNKLRNRSPEK